MSEVRGGRGGPAMPLRLRRCPGRGRCGRLNCVHVGSGRGRVARRARRVRHRVHAKSRRNRHRLRPAACLRSTSTLRLPVHKCARPKIQKLEPSRTPPIHDAMALPMPQRWGRFNSPADLCTLSCEGRAIRPHRTNVQGWMDGETSWQRGHGTGNTRAERTSVGDPAEGVAASRFGSGGVKTSGRLRRLLCWVPALLVAPANMPTRPLARLGLAAVEDDGSFAVRLDTFQFGLTLFNSASRRRGRGRFSIRRLPWR